MLLDIIISFLLIIGSIIFIIGMVKKKKLKICTIALIIISILFLVFIFNKNSIENLNGNITNTNENNNVNLNNVYENVKNATFLYGQISKVEEDKIYIMNNDNKNYILYKDNQEQFMDGRTAKGYCFNELKEGYYIERNLQDDEYLIFKNIIGEELEKELLISLSLPDDVNIMRTNINAIEKVEQLGNNEAIVTFTISDIISSDYFPYVNDDEHIFNVKLKVNNNTKYNSRFHGNNVYNSETIENAKSDAMYYLRLNPNTLNEEYPQISQFDSYSN